MQATQIYQEPRFPIRRVILLAFIGAAVASGIYMAFGGGEIAPVAGDVEVAHRAAVVAGFEIVESNGSQMTIKDQDGDTWACSGFVASHTCGIVAAIGNAPYQRLGYATEAQAADACRLGTVGKIWRKGRVAGFACDISID